MNQILTTFAALVLSLSNYAKKDTFGYVPTYDEKGYLNVQHLNQSIFLSSLQYDSINVDLVIPKGTYILKNNTTIILKPHVNLICDSVTFVYKWETDEYFQDIISFHNIDNSSLQGLTIDFSGAYKDKKPTYSNADKFVNRSIIQIDNCDSVFIKNVKINKIMGAGIWLSNSRWCQILDCDIQNSWVYGASSGVQGYGINIVGTICRDNVISSNQISNVRHAIVAQYGCCYNLIAYNKTKDCVALKKLWFIELMDKTFTYDITGHGNDGHHNTYLGNECEGNLYLDNIKTIGNGPGNQIIKNKVKGRLYIESVAPYYEYNCCQIIKDNEYGSFKVEAKNCEISGNKKIK